MSEQTSDKLLLINADSESSFRVLYDRYWEILISKSYARLGNLEEAEDVVQEVFISLWRNRKYIEIQDSIAPYLFTAIKFATIKRVYRNARKGKLSPLDVEELEKTELTPEELFQFKELEQVLSREVALLPERMQQVYQLRKIEELSIAEISLRLNISEQTVKNTLGAALKKLKAGVSRYTILIYFFM